MIGACTSDGTKVLALTDQDLFMLRAAQSLTVDMTQLGGKGKIALVYGPSVTEAKEAADKLLTDKKVNQQGDTRS